MSEKTPARAGREFVDRVARLAAVLRDLGMQDGDRVAMLGTTATAISSFISAFSGLAMFVVPINSRFALPEMIEQVEDAEPVVLIVDDSLAGWVRSSRKAPRQFGRC